MNKFCIRSLTALFVTCASAVAQAGWRYVVPERPEPVVLLRMLPMQDRAPDGVHVGAELRGAARLGQFRFGDEGSTRVALALDPRPGGGFDLLVDRDRDRDLDELDRIDGVGPIWSIELDVVRDAGESQERESRRLAIHWCDAVGRVGITTTGYLEGMARIGDASAPARRIDGDGNGSFRDPEDRIWLDVDGDGEFDPLGEVFLYRPILTVNGVQHAVREDGERGLVLTELDGVAAIALAAGAAGRTATATLVSSDGLIVGLHEGFDVEVPPGRYRVTNVHVTLPDPAGGRPWSYVFSTSGMRGEPVWHEVAADGRLEVDPIGALDFVANCGKEVEAGRRLVVEPRLYTGDGLLINSCSRGEASHGGPAARVQLESLTGRPLANAPSGFA